MSDIVVGAQVKVDSGNAAPTIKEVREQVKQLKQELDNCKVGSDEHKAAMDRLKAASDQLNPSFKEQTSTLGLIKDRLSSTVPAFGQAAEGAKGFGSMLKTLMANPLVLLIAAIVTGLKFLYDSFTSTSAGAKKAAEIFGALSEVVKVIAERVLGFGRAIISFFTGHFKQAYQEAKAAVSGVGEEIEKTYNETAEGIRRLQALKIAQRQQSIQDAKADADLAKLRESLYDEDTPIKQRIANAAKVKEIDQQRSQTAIKNAKEEMAAKILTWQNEFEWRKKHADDLAELEIGIANAEKDAASSARMAARTERQLVKQQDADDKAKEKEADDKAKEAHQAATEAEKSRRENLRAYTEKLVNLQQQNELNAIRDGYQKKLKEAEFAQAKELSIINEDLKQGKISAAQKANLLVESQKAYNSKVDQINAEHQKDVASKEKEFQKELAAAEGKANLDAIADSRQKERAQLNQQLSEHTQAVLENEKYTQEQKDKLIAAYTDENHKAQAALTAKYQKEDEAKQKELAQKEIALKIAMTKKNFDLQKQEIDFKQKLIDEQYQKEVAAAQGNALKLREIELKHNEDSFAITQSRIALSKAERDAKIADMDAVGSALGAISNLIGQQTVVGKGLAIAQALINTYTGATKALAQGGIAGIAGAIAVTAAGIANVSKIAATQIPGQGSGGSVPAGATSVSAPLQASAVNSTTSLDQTSINAIGNATSRAFVLDSDVQNNRERSTRLNRAARIG